MSEAGKGLRETAVVKDVAIAFLNQLPITRNTSSKRLENAIGNTIKTGEGLVVVSTVCPPYSTDKNGRPTYGGLGCGIEYNIEQHLIHIPPAVKFLNDQGIGATHLFLMADTEVDLQPFLEGKLHISPDEFLARCQTSVDAIDARVKSEYQDTTHGTLGASRFLKYFGEESWYRKYAYYTLRLREEMNTNADLAQSIKNDALLRADLISKLLGKSISFDERVDHIVRQKSQYMAFASLMREKFGRRLVIVNHSTPNFAWMNHKLVREPENPVDLINGNYLFELPLIELDISTMPAEAQ